ncbi:MAG TPA: hemerythrin domain-containing protein [Terriglobales bacterium]|jgi:iron-sulfur cluster repair protein YtfE (RIC family)|nr:hemerythrin domain-containing protein [Terriglobales bacterium]
MLRDKSLVPLSHQHQHALALCVRIERDLASGGGNLGAWQEEIVKAFASEIRFHFEAEEKLLFPSAKKHGALDALIVQLLREHTVLRGFFARAERGQLDATTLRAFVATLSQHIRTEERQLFELCQQLMSEEELTRLGADMKAYFENSGMPGAACTVRPSPPE